MARRHYMNYGQVVKAQARSRSAALTPLTLSNGGPTHAPSTSALPTIRPGST